MAAYGYGFAIVVAFVMLTLAIVIYACLPILGRKEGFQPVPSPLSLTADSASAGGSKSTGVTGRVSDLPSAPITDLASSASLPYQDPALVKSSLQMINELKQDMDGFATREMPHMKDKSDPTIQLPLTRFQGDHQRVKDEIAVLTANPGLQSQITVEQLTSMGANLRFLQRIYRTYAASNLVPAAPEISQNNASAPSTEGFADASGSKGDKISKTELNLLSVKLGVEITRLQASGTTDPILVARVGVFTKIKQTVDDFITRLGNGTMTMDDIPIKKSDYNKFLPALGDTSAGIGGLLSKNGLGSLSSLFNAYDAGDISGSKLAGALLDMYANDLVKGLSISLSYTSPSELANNNALAAYASASSGMLHPGVSFSHSGGLNQGSGALNPGSRGEFDSTIRDLDDVAGFMNTPAKPKQAGKFDWKARAKSIRENIKRAGMNPADYGCLDDGAHVSQGYSWRGHTKMVCSRLSTNADPGIPEQMGCPPVSWRGWRS